jgi:hypothetical protein
MDVDPLVKVYFLSVAYINFQTRFRADEVIIALTLGWTKPSHANILEAPTPERFSMPSTNMNGRKLYFCSMKRSGPDNRRAPRGRRTSSCPRAQAMKRLMLNRLDPERCRFCRARIFLECSQMPQKLEKIES